jgi:CBS domain-containing protein
MHVRDAMTPGIDYCFEDEDVRTAARHMQDKQVRRLPVLDRKKRIVGIVSLGDMAVRSGDERLSGQTLGRISEPAAPSR